MRNFTGSKGAHKAVQARAVAADQEIMVKILNVSSSNPQLLVWSQFKARQICRTGQRSKPRRLQPLNRIPRAGIDD